MILFHASGRHLTCDTYMFDTIIDWEQELTRCKAEKSWRVADANMNFDLAQTYVLF